MRVAKTPDFLESIANSERVRPWVGGEGEVRAGESWERTLALEWDDGGVVFLHEGDGVWDGHLVFARGARDCLPKTLQAVRYLFCVGQARELRAVVPHGYHHVTRIVRALGMHKIKDENGASHYRLRQHKESAQ